MREQRLFPRIPTQLAARVFDPTGDTKHCKVRNLSPGGLMLDGDLLLKELLTETDYKKAANTPPPEVTIEFEVPKDSTPIRCRCRMVFIRRLSQTEFNFGFRFIGFESNSATRLENYLNQQMDLPAGSVQQSLG